MRKKKSITLRSACLHCGTWLEHSSATQSARCPSCHKGMALEDVELKRAAVVGRIETCGLVTIPRKSQVQVAVVVSGRGVEVLGELRGRIETRGTLHIGPEGRFSGDCRVGAIQVDDGGELNASRLEIVSANGAGEGPGERGVVRLTGERFAQQAADVRRGIHARAG